MQQAFKASDLAPDERVALERLLGRSLRNDEAFELTCGSRRPRRAPVPPLAFANWPKARASVGETSAN